MSICLAMSMVSATLLCAVAEPPEGFVRESIGSGWSNPVGIAERFDGRYVVWERGGRLWLVDSDGTVHDDPWLDLSDEVGGWRDHGLLGFALHPAFEQTGWIYLLYVVDRHHLLNAGTKNYDPVEDEYFAATIGRLTRFTATSADGFDSVDPDSRTVLLGETPQTGLPILFESHSVGSLVFGEDGTLLVSMGDSASFVHVDTGGHYGGSYVATALAEGILAEHEDVGSYRSQMVDSMCGKILRIDPLTGDGISSNPFYEVTQPRSRRSRVWALGFRNPFRMTLIPGSGSHEPGDADPGTLLVGDVGWFLKEEFSLIDGAGQNAGWPVFEGLDLAPKYPESAPAHPLAPNPMADVEKCDSEFLFSNLLLQDTQQPDPLFLNPCGVYEAEDAQYSGPIFTTYQYGYLGAGYLDFQDDFNDFIRWTISVDTTGTYNLLFRYALRQGTDRPLRLEIDGKTFVESLSFLTTGSFGEWRMHAVSVPLVAGTHTVALHAIGSSGGNFDCLVVDDGTPGSIVEVPEEIPVFLHRRPLVDFQHGSSGSRVPIFVNGAAANVLLGSGESPVSGDQFPGYCSIGGPYMNEQDGWPDEWEGAYFSDYVYGWIRVAGFEPDGTMSSIRLFDTGGGNIVFLGRSHEGGALFMINFNGEIWRYSWDPDGNQAPTARITTSVSFGPSPLSVTLDASMSSDPEEEELLFTWDFGDGSPPSTGPVVQHIFVASSSEPERFDVVLAVEDPQGATGSSTALISVNNTPPTVLITSPVDGSLYSIEYPSVLELVASISDAEHGESELACAWTTVLHHNTHTHDEPPRSECGSSAQLSPLGCGAEEYWYELKLVVTDGAGLSTTASSQVYPDCDGILVCPADLDGNGVVDGADLSQLLGAWNTLDADLSGDGITNGADLTILLAAWGYCQ